MIRMILTLLLIYIVYKFVFEFVIPIFNTTRQMSNKVKDAGAGTQKANGRAKKYPPGPIRKPFARRLY